MTNKYVLEFVRDGIVIRHSRPWGARADRATARKYARVFADRLPEAATSWKRHIGWMIRIVDRNTGLIVGSYERQRAKNGRLVVRSL